MSKSKEDRINKTKGTWFSEPGNVSDGMTDDGLQPFWQFRIAVKPNRGQNVKAAQALLQVNELMSKFHPEWKIFIPKENNSLDSWDATIKGGDRDQRGKEICVYMEYQKYGKKPEYYDGDYPSPEYLKGLMLHMWKALQDAGVELAYITPGVGEKEIVCTDGSLTPFSYSSFKPYAGRNQFLESNEYNPTHQQDPLKGVEFTPEDLSEHGINRLGKLTSAKRLVYQINHYKDALHKLHEAMPGELSYQKFTQSIKDAFNEQDPDKKLNSIDSLIKAYRSTSVAFLGKARQIDFAIQILDHCAKKPGTAEELNGLLNNLQEKIRDEKNLVIKDLKRIGLDKTDEELSDLFDKNPDAAMRKYEIFVHLEHEKAAIKHESERFKKSPAAEFPKSYSQLSKFDSLESARSLLDDYTKGDSALSRFFHFHWFRHHVKEVATIVRQIDSGEIKNLDVLIDNLNKISVKNPTGSFARRLEMIVGRHAEELLKDEELGAGNSNMKI